MKFRLSLLMFLQYFTAGATLPVMSLYLTGTLGFSGFNAGLVFFAGAVATLLSPFLSALLADRLIDTERLYGIFHLAGGALLVALFFMRGFLSVFLLYFLYMLVYGATESMANSITFHHSADSGKGFGGIRRWGTAGWIVVAWFFSFFWLSAGSGSGSGRISYALLVGAGSAIAAGGFAFTLPRVGCKPEKLSSLIPRESMAVFRGREVLLFTVVGFLMTFLEKYYYFGAAPFLADRGMAERMIMPAMSLGQVTELSGMSVLAFLMGRFGIRVMLLLGVAMEGLKFLLFSAAGTDILPMLGGILCHGLFYAFFFTAGFIFLDRNCSVSTRTGVHQIFWIATPGFGGLAGSIASGKIMDLLKTADGSVRYGLFWSLPLTLIIAGFLVILIGFRDTRERRS